MLNCINLRLKSYEEHIVAAWIQMKVGRTISLPQNDRTVLQM